MKKVALIGPVFPYKGGISHYTGLLYRALAKKHETIMVSYKMQYPRFLFKKEQCDYSNDQFKIEGTNFWINTANPFSCIISARKMLKEQVELVIFQWWHPYFAPCYWILERILKKHTKILFVCHNVFPHERFPFDHRLAKMALIHANYYIVQSKQDEQDLLSIKQSAIFKRTVHPTYNIFKINNISKEQARQMLHIPPDKKILLFFGFVREYKGLQHLLQAMPLARKYLTDLCLLVVGDFDENKDKYLDLLHNLRIEDIVSVYDGYIPDQEVEKFFAASDLVVLPYESATQSGIVQISYGFEKPVIVTDVGGLPEVVNDGKTGYIVQPKNPQQIADKIIEFYEQQENINFSQNIQKEAYRYSWERLVTEIEYLIEETT